MTIKHNYADFGTLDQILNNLAYLLGITWSIQNNTIIIMGSKFSNSKETLLLTPQNGLILNPDSMQVFSRLIQRKSGTDAIQTLLKGNKYAPALVRKTHTIQALLQSKLQIKEIIRVQSKDLNGIFQVQKIEHTGDTHDEPWYSSIQLLAIK
jgi:hypothetical protein